MASERGLAQTIGMFKSIYVVPMGSWDVSSGRYGALGRLQNWRLVEACWICISREGERPVNEKRPVLLDMFPSSAGHVKPRANLGGPSPKAKYSLVTDSEPVP